MTRRAACALQALQVVERSEPDVGGLLRRMVSTTASDRPSAIQLIKAFKQLRMPRLLSLFALAGSDVRCGRCRQSLQAVVLWSLRCFDRKARAAPQEAVQEAGVLRKLYRVYTKLMTPTKSIDNLG